MIAQKHAQKQEACYLLLLLLSPFPVALLWQHYGILNWHGSTHRLAWWDHLKNPGKFPPYGFSLNTWWTEKK